jgi:hypothetical protein
MKSWIMPVLLAVALFGGSFVLRAVALADGAAEVAPPDAAVTDPAPGGLAGSPSAIAAVDIADPLESPSDFWDDVKNAKNTGWPALVVVLLFAAFRLLRGKIAWFREGTRAAYTAGAVTILGACVDWLMGGGTWVAAAAAALSTIALLLNPTLSGLSLGGGKAPGPVADDNVKFPK